MRTNIFAGAMIVLGVAQLTGCGQKYAVDLTGPSAPDSAQSKNSVSTTTSIGSNPVSGESSTNSGSSVAPSTLIECELPAPNSKVVLLGGVFQVQPSNASGERICMSENACLSLINTYAQARGCSLALGAPTSSSPSGAQCTAIFPGSQGTCHNATVETDADVTAMLASMSNP